jgi:hypothetical protein
MVIVVGALIVCFMENANVGITLIAGLIIGCVGGACFPWDDFEGF